MKLWRGKAGLPQDEHLAVSNMPVEMRRNVRFLSLNSIPGSKFANLLNKTHRFKSNSVQ